MKGWYGNRQAHGLASRGIKTARVRKHEDFLTPEKLILDYEDGHRVEGNVVFTTHDIDGDWNDSFQYDSKEKLIDYAWELWDANNPEDERDFLSEKEPKTLQDAIKYLRDLRIVVSLDFDGVMYSPNGKMIVWTDRPE